jgi:hypothetical protein
MGLTFTFAADESGDVSLKFEKGASRYFVLAVVVTQNPDALRGFLEKLRNDLNLSIQYEFGFHKLASVKLRDKVFTALSGADFDAWVILVDKAMLGESFKAMTGIERYLFFVAELILLIPEGKRAGGTLILDEFGDPEKTKNDLKRILRDRSIAHGFRRISLRRSQSEPLIQIADLLAGAVWRRDSHNDTGAYETIEHKIKKLVEYRG